MSYDSPESAGYRVLWSPSFNSGEEWGPLKSCPQCLGPAQEGLLPTLPSQVPPALQLLEDGGRQWAERDKVYSQCLPPP